MIRSAVLWAVWLARPAVAADPPAPAPAPPQAIGQMCPVYVSGVEVAVSDAPGAFTLTFTTTSGDVKDLQRRVRALADTLGSGTSWTGQPGAGAGPGGPMMGAGGGRMGPGGGMGYDGAGLCGPMMAGTPPTGTATVADVKSGAQVTVTPADPTQANALRARMHLLTAHLVAGTCPMWMGSVMQSSPVD